MSSLVPIPLLSSCHFPMSINLKENGNENFMLTSSSLVILSISHPSCVSQFLTNVKIYQPNPFIRKKGLVQLPASWFESGVTLLALSRLVSGQCVMIRRTCQRMPVYPTVARKGAGRSMSFRVLIFLQGQVSNNLSSFMFSHLKGTTAVQQCYLCTFGNALRFKSLTLKPKGLK